MTPYSTFSYFFLLLLFAIPMVWTADRGRIPGPKWLLVATLLCNLLPIASAQTPATLPSESPTAFVPTDSGFDYQRREVMIPMRDGVKLFTVVVMKKGVTKAPILLSRTPYNASGSTGRVNSQRIVDILEVMDAEFVTDNSF